MSQPAVRTGADMFGATMLFSPLLHGVVHIANGQLLKPGQFVDVVIEDADEHDLHARLLAITQPHHVIPQHPQAHRLV